MLRARREHRCPLASRAQQLAFLALRWPRDEASQGQTAKIENASQGQTAKIENRSTQTLSPQSPAKSLTIPTGMIASLHHAKSQAQPDSKTEVRRPADPQDVPSRQAPKHHSRQSARPHLAFLAAAGSLRQTVGALGRGRDHWTQKQTFESGRLRHWRHG